MYNNSWNALTLFLFSDTVALLVCIGTATCRVSQYIRTGSDLTQIPRDIPSEVWKVDLGHNAIDTLEISTFSNLSLCSYLRLSFNKISVIESGAFSGLVRLAELHLDNNAMTEIKADTFVGAESLFRLELGNNDITIIDAGAFGMMSRLEELKLFGNDLTSIRGDMWKGIDALIGIRFREQLFSYTTNG